MLKPREPNASIPMSVKQKSRGINLQDMGSDNTIPVTVLTLTPALKIHSKTLDLHRNMPTEGY